MSAIPSLEHGSNRPLQLFRNLTRPHKIQSDFVDDAIILKPITATCTDPLRVFNCRLVSLYVSAGRRVAPGLVARHLQCPSPSRANVPKSEITSLGMSLSIGLATSNIRMKCRCAGGGVAL